MATELAGPESVPPGGGPGISGTAGPLTAGATLGGSSGHSDPAVTGISSVQSRVLSGSGDSDPGLVGVGVVGDFVECGESDRSRPTVERANSSPNRTHTTHQNPDLTPDLTIS